MPRAAYTGSSTYGVFWGGDIGGTQEGLARVDHRPAAFRGNGLSKLGLGHLRLQPAVDGTGSLWAWLAFGALTPIMEVGPTRNVGFLEPAARTEL